MLSQIKMMEILGEGLNNEALAESHIASAPILGRLIEEV